MPKCVMQSLTIHSDNQTQVPCSECQVPAGATCTAEVSLALCDNLFNITIPIFCDATANKPARLSSVLTAVYA
jgi:hypothetical protein